MVTHFVGKRSHLQRTREMVSEECQAVRLTGVPGKGRRPESRQPIREVSRVQSGVVLQQSARRAAQTRARELVRGADSGLRPSEVRETSRPRCQVSAVQGGDVLQQEAQIEACVGARQQVRGAAHVQVAWRGGMSCHVGSAITRNARCEQTDISRASACSTARGIGLSTCQRTRAGARSCARSGSMEVRHVEAPRICDHPECEEIPDVYVRCRQSVAFRLI
jgi:hypothetical protein